MSSPAGDFIWEIPDSDEELPGADPVRVQDHVSIANDKDRYDYRNILKFFPPGRHGLLARPPPSDNSSLIVPPALDEPRDQDTTGNIRRQESTEDTASNGRTPATSTEESPTTSASEKSTDDEAPVPREPAELPVRKEAVESLTETGRLEPPQTLSDEFSALLEAETASDDDLPFLQNPLYAPRRAGSQEQNHRRSIDERDLPLSPDALIVKIDIPEPLDEDAAHLQNHGALSTREEVESQSQACPEEESTTPTGSKESLNDESTKNEGQAATRESHERPYASSSYAVSTDTRPDATLGDALTLASQISNWTIRKATGKDDDTFWSISTTEPSSPSHDLSQRLRYHITPETNPPSTVPIPTKRTSSRRAKIHRDGREIQPWSANELIPSITETYTTILRGIQEVIAVYDEKGYDLYEDEPLQFPSRRSKSHDMDDRRIKSKNSLRHCRCRSKKEGRKDKSVRQQCYDPACEVLGGWYHLSCLSEEELRDMLTVEHWICRPCIARRAQEGFPELHSNSVMEDRHRRIVRMVLSWAEDVTLIDRSRGGKDKLTAHERAYMEKVDRSLRSRGLWPEVGDKVLCMYQWWARGC